MVDDDPLAEAQGGELHSSREVLLDLVGGTVCGWGWTTVGQEAGGLASEYGPLCSTARERSETSIVSYLTYSVCQPLMFMTRQLKHCGGVV